MMTVEDGRLALQRAVARESRRDHWEREGPRLLAHLSWLVETLLNSTDKTDREEQLDALADRYSGVFADHIHDSKLTITFAAKVPE